MNWGEQVFLLPTAHDTLIDEVEASALISTSVLQIQIVIIDNFIRKDLQEKFSQDWSDRIYLPETLLCFNEKNRQETYRNTHWWDVWLCPGE